MAELTEKKYAEFFGKNLFRNVLTEDKELAAELRSKALSKKVVESFDTRAALLMDEVLEVEENEIYEATASTRTEVMNHLGFQKNSASSKNMVHYDHPKAPGHSVILNKNGAWRHQNPNGMRYHGIGHAQLADHLAAHGSGKAHSNAPGVKLPDHAGSMFKTNTV